MAAVGNFHSIALSSQGQIFTFGKFNSFYFRSNYEIIDPKIIKEN
jgi:hypothetical protein